MFPDGSIRFLKMPGSKIIKIAIIGPESTGKSTLCQDLAQHYNTVYVPEYARQYFTKKKNIDDYSLNDLETIYVHQVENEKKASSVANRFLFCDTTLITGKIWALEEFRIIPHFISQNISKIKYDLYLLTSNDVEWKKDPLRKSEHKRDHHFNRNLEELELLQGNYKVIDGLGEDRLQKAIQLIDSLYNL
jgi:NadR type nicotinamide-nucleotide adenylyltransferase